MAALKIIEYAGPANGRIRKPSLKHIAKQSSCPDTNLQMNAGNKPVEVPPVLGGVAGDGSWHQKATEDVEDISRVSSSHLVRNKSMDKSEYTDDELPSSTSFHPPKNEHTSAEERPSVENTAVTGSQDLNINPVGARGWIAPGSYDKPIELNSDDRSEDDSNLDNGHTPRVVTSGKQSYDASNQEHLPPISNHIAPKHSVDDTINRIKPPTVKRPRSNSISTFIPCQPRTLPLLHNEDEEGSKELVSDSDPGESGADDICSKRRKVSTPQGRRIVSRNNPSQPSPPLSEDDEDSGEDGGTLSISLDARLTSSPRSTPASEVPSPTELEVCPVVTDVDQDWDVREIIGKEEFDGVSYYLVDWHPTLLPEHSLGHAKELVDKFEARIRAQRGVDNKRGGLGSKTRQKASVETKALSSQQGKKPRGRPRKQT